MRGTVAGGVALARVRPLDVTGSITDVRGVRVGHWTDEKGMTGCTVVLCGRGTVGGVSVLGGAPGTRETDPLHALAASERLHAIVLAGGSAYGLSATDGVMRYLEERGIGFRVGRAIVPLVASAILFDLAVGDPTARPDADAGYAACEAASTRRPREGRVGAGTGATVAKLFGRERARRGGMGTASLRAGRVIVGALFAVNCVGEVVDERGRVLAGPRGMGSLEAALLRGRRPVLRRPTRESTTIGVVATNAALSKVEANLLARLAHDGLARAIRPAHTRFDGDTIFAVGTGRPGGRADFEVVAAAAAEVSARAIRRAVTR